MKKNSIILLVLTLIAGTLLSQPTITYNGNAPQIGDVHYFSNSEDMLDPGPSGANQTWDYSVINVISTNQATIMDPNSTPFASDFPGCNQVFHFDGTTTYIYSDLSQSMVNHHGEGFDTVPPMIIYFTDPMKEIEFPFFYNDSFTDESFSSFEYMGMTTHRRATSTVTADAWGTVITPENTYNNVLRIKNVVNQVDSVWFEGIYVTGVVSNYTHYGWHTASSHTAVMAISILVGDFGTSYASHYTTSSQHIIDPLAGISKLQVSPNPANDNIQVSFEASGNTQFQFSIIDLTGKEVLHKEYLSCKPGNQITNMNINSLNAGLYFVKIDNGTNSVTKKLIKN